MASIRWIRGVAWVLAIATVPAQGAPLASAFSGTGSYGLDVDAVGISAASMVDSTLGSGNKLTLSNITPVAMVVQAYLYAYDINHPGTMMATFGGASLLGGTPVGPLASDAAFNTLQTFRWDVTNHLVPGVASYDWSFAEVTDPFGNQGSSIAMAALAVVFSDPALAATTVTISDGMDYVGNTHPETEAMTVAGLPAGSTTIYMATFLDDNQATGETIALNGTTVGGPLDGNLALNGSLTQATGTSIGGTNTLAITTQSDEFGWTLTATTTPVPVPAALWLLGSALPYFMLARRRRPNAPRAPVP